MEIKIKKQNSILRVLTLAMIFLVFFQSILLLLFFISGGVLTQVKQNSYQSYTDKVMTRLSYMENRMANNWMLNAQSMQEQLVSLLEKDITAEQFFIESAPVLISTMRSGTCSGAFIILEKEKEEDITYPALILEDKNPTINSSLNTDITALIGLETIINQIGISMDSNWKRGIQLDETNKDCYTIPMKNAALSRSLSVVGYWSQPFHFYSTTEKQITYSMPLVDKYGTVWGVTGISISLDYFISMLTDNKLIYKSSLGYFIAYKNKENEIYPIITSGSMQDYILNKDIPLQFIEEDMNYGIYELKEHNGNKKIMTCLKKIELYNIESPYSEESWYLVGLIEKENLLKSYYKVMHIFLFSIIASTLLGIFCAVIISRKFAKPIRYLAKEVRESDISLMPTFKKSSYTELNEIIMAVETANQNFIENTSNLIQIVNLLNLPIGIFEYAKDFKWSFLSDYLFQLLFDKDVKKDNVEDYKAYFRYYLGEILIHPVNGEENIYLIERKSNSVVYVKIDMIENEKEVIGIATDVTKEILEREKIRKQRDYDTLTGLCSRIFFEDQVKKLIQKEEQLNVAAFVMFDLDCFKEINDTYGHECGDQYLKCLANYFKQFEEKSSICGRRSGDEFYAFFYRYSSKKEIIEIINKFYEQLKEEPFCFPDGTKSNISVSSGLAWYNKEETEFGKLMGQADSALYISKRTKKGELVIPIEESKTI